jgi:hypothetical protein
MDQGKKRRWLHVPSPAMIVACVALFIAMGGTSYAAATLAANSVGTKQIKKNAVTSAKIKSAAVTAAKVKDGTLTGAKIQDGTLTGAKIQDGSVAGADLAAGAVDTTKVGTIPGARVKRSSAATFDSGVSAWLSFNVTDYNVGGVFDAVQPTRMTAPVAGRYLIIATARWDANTAGRRTIALELNHSAGTIARSNVSPYWTGNSLAPEQSVQVVYKMNAGDYVEVFAMQDSGGALSMTTAVDNAVTFSMQWLAP